VWGGEGGERETVGKAASAAVPGLARLHLAAHDDHPTAGQGTDGKNAARTQTGLCSLTVLPGARLRVVRVHVVALVPCKAAQNLHTRAMRQTPPTCMPRLIGTSILPPAPYSLNAPPGCRCPAPRSPRHRAPGYQRQATPSTGASACRSSANLPRDQTRGSRQTRTEAVRLRPALWQTAQRRSACVKRSTLAPDGSRCPQRVRVLCPRLHTMR